MPPILEVGTLEQQQTQQSMKLLDDVSPDDSYIGASTTGRPQSTIRDEQILNHRRSSMNNTTSQASFSYGFNAYQNQQDLNRSYYQEVIKPTISHRQTPKPSLSQISRRGSIMSPKTKMSSYRSNSASYNVMNQPMGSHLLESQRKFLGSKVLGSHRVQF